MNEEKDQVQHDSSINSEESVSDQATLEEADVVQPTEEGASEAEVEPTEKEEPVCDEEPVEEEERADGEESDEEEEPVGDEESAEEEEPVGDEEPAEEEKPADDEEPADDNEPGDVEESVEDEGNAEEEESADDEEPADVEESVEDEGNAEEEQFASDNEALTEEEENMEEEDGLNHPRPWFAHYDKEIAPSLHYPNINIAQFLIDAAENYPKHKAVEFMGNILTYEQIYLKANHLAKYLCSIGIKKGDRVAIMLPNTPQAVIAYYGVLLAGAVVVQTNPLYVERELKYQLKDSGAVALITLDLLINRVIRVRGERLERKTLSFLKTVIVTSIADGLKFPKNKLYRLSQRKNIPPIPDPDLGYVLWGNIFKRDITYERPQLDTGHTLAAIQYTGGTTGTPKGVMLSHHNLVANTLQTGAWCYKAKKGNEIFLAALPLFHVFGLTVLMNYSVSQAGLLILLPKFEVEKVLKAIEKKRPTIFPGAPTMYIAVLQAAAKSKRALDLSSVDICISGSAALPLEVQEKFEQYTGGRLVEGYGLSETSPVTHANPIWGTRKIGTIGLPFPDTEAAIIDPVTGKLLPPNEIGELVIKGPQVMMGYWNKPEATAQSFINGWFRTGDLGKMDEDGFFSIVDRIKDIIIASGFNIYPREIEEVLYEHPAIKEAAVLGVKDYYRGETVKAFIVFKEGEAATEEELDKYCRSKLAAFKVPQYYEFRDTLPKTMVGKILKRQLKEE